MTPRTYRLLVLIAAGGLSLTASCRLYNLERHLNPENADFLNKVRYIITAQERKEFLLTPDSEKPQYIESFWKRRDPDPDTPENEFQIDYLNRLQRATEMFIGEGMPGWLTDRGRIYILFGPPTDRITEPMGADSYSRCQEVWYYGDFPVLFSDPSCTGSYKLVTYNLSGLRSIDLEYMHELNMAQAEAARTPEKRREVRLTDFDASVEIKVREPERIEAVVTVVIPYDRIWFKSEGKTFWTTLETRIELRDSKKAVVWQGEEKAELKMDQADLERSRGQSYKIGIPLIIGDKEKVAELDQGPALLTVTVVNSTGNETMKKVLDFK
jgi:GWxTD domain-containing protein